MRTANYVPFLGYPKYRAKTELRIWGSFFPWSFFTILLAISAERGLKPAISIHDLYFEKSPRTVPIKAVFSFPLQVAK